MQELIMKAVSEKKIGRMKQQPQLKAQIQSLKIITKQLDTKQQDNKSSEKSNPSQKHLPTQTLNSPSPNSPTLNPRNNMGLRTQNFISQFLDYEIYKQKNLNPQFLRIKNNILLIILVLSSFGIYYLFENFIDVMLLAFIGGIFFMLLRQFVFGHNKGVGYQQMRERFIRLWLNDEPFFQKEMTLFVRILSIFGYLLLIFILPWIRISFGYPDEFLQHLLISDFLYAFSSKTNVVVLCLQLVLLLRVLHLILAPKIFPIIARHAPKNIGFYKWTFGFIFTMISLAAVFTIPSVLAMQVSHGGYRIQKKVQEHLKCQLISYSNYNTSLPACSEIFFKNNTFFEQTFKEFKAQTSQVEDCMTYLSQLQKRIIGYEFFQYKQMTCTSYLILLKASYYLTPDTDVLATGTTFLKTIFGNIALIIMSLSNIIFSVTSFATIFYITVVYFDPRSTVMQEIFFGERKELLGQITNLIQATLFIVVEHFLLSVVLLELFNFSHFNMLISTFLSSMAFVPFFRPWFGALFFCIIRSAFMGNHIINLIFLVVYYYLSEQIFSFRLQQMQFHVIITNMSILFGIYQFGIAGIFYGPIIIILFRSVHRELLRNQVYTTQDSPESSCIGKN